MISRDFYIVPECYVDTNFVETLLNTSAAPTAGVNHQKGCNNVIGVIQSKLEDGFAIGVLDDDKKQVPFLSSCNAICESKHVSLLKERDKSHYVFLIRPAMDGFILDAAIDQNVKPEDFGFSSELKKFTKSTKEIETKNDANMTRLIKAIRGNLEIEALQDALVYLKENTFSSKDNDLKELFANAVAIFPK